MQRKGGTRCVERNKRVAAYHVEENAQPPAWTQGFVNLNPPPCDSHRGGIQVDEPFCRRGRRMVCAVQPSLLPHDAFLAQGKLTAPVILKCHRTCPSLLRLHTAMDAGEQATLKKLWKGGRRGTLCAMGESRLPGGLWYPRPYYAQPARNTFWRAVGRLCNRPNNRPFAPSIYDGRL